MASSWVVALDLVGATPRQPVGEDLLPTKVSYFKGPKNEWRTGLPSYGSVVYREPWPGVGPGGERHGRGAEVDLCGETRSQPRSDPPRLPRGERGATRAERLAGRRHATWRDPRAGADCLPGGGRSSRGGSGGLRARARRRSRAAKPTASGSASTTLARELVVDPVTLVYCGYIGGSQLTTVAKTSPSTPPATPTSQVPPSSTERHLPGDGRTRPDPQRQRTTPSWPRSTPTAARWTTAATSAGRMTTPATASPSTRPATPMSLAYRVHRGELPGQRRTGPQLQRQRRRLRRQGQRRRHRAGRTADTSAVSSTTTARASPSTPPATPTSRVPPTQLRRPFRSTVGPDLTLQLAATTPSWPRSTPLVPRWPTAATSADRTDHDYGLGHRRRRRRERLRHRLYRVHRGDLPGDGRTGPHPQRASDAFVAKVNTAGTALDYCGYIGGEFGRFAPWHRRRRRRQRLRRRVHLFHRGDASR